MPMRKRRRPTNSPRRGKLARSKRSLDGTTTSAPFPTPQLDLIMFVLWGRKRKSSKVTAKPFVAHAESYAIDLMWDMICRFGPSNDMPREFYDDFVRIAHEESQHYTSWTNRLRDFNSFYGDLPGHDGLWDSAAETSSDIRARLALVHLVHEARGLDTYPMAVDRFTKSGDTITLAFMEKNHREEVTHVEAGVRWFTYMCERDEKPVLPTFYALVRSHYVGALKPPFNTAARARANMSEEWYLPLCEDVQIQS
ncbi:hypothetical protein Ae201684P_007218 [Aphanomyces euteiches]|nr:hypothetical protein Ae201684P_007218 [Aphanomyces euteiches]